MKQLLTLVLLILISKSDERRRKYYDDITVESLCDDPTDFKTDSLVNNSVRIYKKDHYWELSGLPDNDNAFLLGPYKIWYPNLAPVKNVDTVVTELEGHQKGRFYRFRGRRWQGWDPRGHQWYGGKEGIVWDQLVSDAGFNAMFHNANKSAPMIVVLDNIYVRYYSTRSQWLEPIDRESWGSGKGHSGGKFGERFPTDIDTAFSLPAENPSDGYVVYLFKRDEYCFRPQWLKSGKDCDQWVKITKLFGCDEKKPTSDDDSTGDGNGSDGGKGTDDGKGTNDGKGTDDGKGSGDEKEKESADRNSSAVCVYRHLYLILLIVFKFL